MFILILIVYFFSYPSFCAQPDGLVLKPPVLPMGRRILRNKDITFTEEDSKKNQKVEEVYVLKTKYRVKGRSRPGRSGSVVSVIESGETVRLLKDSSDGRWKAVYVNKSGVKVWLPSAALTKKKTKNKDYSSSGDSEDVSDDMSSDE